ncbi:hypothetical protein LAJ19_14260 (plasmid) [Deinococcus taeanensis]|uniref:hypothetical protein n=1 Tax=Deinococcus taeanensis TaxID=2737050 RepID=UPI001CDC86D2|nr:hypothetical protein [Deinococcus taeanensis]UBV44328.1 hypothetical protein LAJ19_14260 [Deinococcus taeanensis]
MKDMTVTPGFSRAAPAPAAPLAGQRVPLRLNDRRIIRFLSVTAAVLIAVGFWGIYSKTFLPDFFARDLVWSLTYLNGETNLPSLFSTLLLLSAAAALGVIALARRAALDPFRRVWTGLTLLFVYLGLDEGASLHELLIEPVHDLVKVEGALHYAWVVPYGLLALTVFVVCLRFLRHLPRGTRNGMLLAGAVYISGAFGLELAEGYVRTLMGRDTFLMEILITAEEALEMAGVILFLSTLLRYVRLALPDLELRVGLTRD